MPKKITITQTYISESADVSTTPAGAFTAVLASVILQLNGNNVTSKFTDSFKGWVGYAATFARSLGINKEFNELVKQYQSNNLDEDFIQDFGKMLLKDLRPKLDSDTTIPQDVLNLMLDCGRSLATDSDTAWNRIEKNISVLKSSKLASVFSTEDDSPVEIDGIDPKAASKKIVAVYKKITGKDLNKEHGYFLRPEQIVAAKDKMPKVLAEYGTLSKVLNKELKRQIFKMVRSSGSDKIPVEKVARELDRQGIITNVARGFPGGMVDEKGLYYTAQGRQLDKIPVGKVVLNPNYDPEKDNTYVLWSEVWGNKTGAGRARTTSFLTGNKNKRHSLVSEFIKDEDKYRRKWLADLNKKGTKEQVMAAMLELLWSTSARVGGKANKTKGETTYGLSTLLASHVKVTPSAIKFDYVGKKLSPQPAVYKLSSAESKKVAQIVQKCLEDKSKTDVLFTWRDRDVNDHAIRLYAKSLGMPISIHGLRRVSGTKVAAGLLAKNPFSKKKGAVKEAVVTKWFKEEMKKVGEVLHHRTGEKVTGLTAVKAYVDPGVVADFYTSLGLRVPKFVPHVKSGE